MTHKSIRCFHSQLIKRTKVSLTASLQTLFDTQIVNMKAVFLVMELNSFILVHFSYYDSNY
jgi:hypothetical protein